MTGRNQRANLFLIVLTFVLAAVFMIPLYWMVRSSFMNLKELYQMDPMLLFPPKLRLDNYLRVFMDSNINLLQELKNSLVIAIAVVFGTVITSSLAAFGFARLRFPLRNLWFALVISSMLLPSAVTLIPTFLMWNALGQIGSFYPLIVPAWLGGGAYFIFLLRQFFLTIPRDLDEAAIIDGANYFTVYYRVMLPLIKPALVVVALFSFIGAWNEFFYAYIYLSAEESYTLMLGLQTLRGVQLADFTGVMAMATLVTIPTFIFFLIGNRYFVEGITLTGIKG
ncbi:MAG TPA: carbohydrate ABC transporter permease [Bacillota bacterium]